jgi:hypothetical protein
MSKVLVAVLTNGKPEKLDRCLKSVNSNSSPHERIVVINITDTESSSLATQISFDNGYAVAKGKCDDDPVKGKMSVLRYFHATTADYLFYVNADDYNSHNSIASFYKKDDVEAEFKNRPNIDIENIPSLDGDFLNMYEFFEHL